MDPVTMVIVPGFLGGLVLAWLFIKLPRRHPNDASPDAFRDLPLSTDVINMAHIRVAGIGGLGLVAVAVWTAIVVPRIGQTLSVGLVLGGVLAAVLIIWRRRHGAMPSSGRRAGANTTLSIDAPFQDAPRKSDRFSQHLSIPAVPARVR